MNYLFLDIETIPTQDVKIREAIAANIKPPGNISKADTIAKWEAEQKPQAVKEAIHKTCLDGGLGHICCIGSALNGASSDALLIDDIKDEADLLTSAFAKIGAQFPSHAEPIIVGHNVIGFDLRMLIQRAIVLGVRVPRWIPRDAKPWDHKVHDTMLIWAGPRGMIGLDRLCAHLGVDGKIEDGMDGSQVAARWERRAFQEIAEYCAGDVDLVRSVHRKMSDALLLPPMFSADDLALNDFDEVA